MSRSIGLSLSIDVSKIDKSKLYQGKKGTYLDATIFVNLDEKDQYDNNGMVTQSLPKEERDAGNKGAILGNGSVFWQGESQVGGGGQQQSNQAQQNFDTSDDQIPF